MRGFSMKLFTYVAVAAALASHSLVSQANGGSYNKTCRPLYLTLDTGNMRDAEAIGDFLRGRNIKATFFLANEKTTRGDYALDNTWAPYWKRLAADGHAFGSHTLRHGRILPALKKADSPIVYRPQFGADAGQPLLLDAKAFCDELKAVNVRFRDMTGQSLNPVWRAPGGHVTPQSLKAANQCGYAHVGWHTAGFLGDELDSERNPNRFLVERALSDIVGNEIIMAHLGIWSRKELFLPAFKEIVSGLQDKGFCFKTLREHPLYKDDWQKQPS